MPGSIEAHLVSRQRVRNGRLGSYGGGEKAEQNQTRGAEERRKAHPGSFKQPRDPPPVDVRGYMRACPRRAADTASSRGVRGYMRACPRRAADTAPSRGARGHLRVCARGRSPTAPSFSKLAESKKPPALTRVALQLPGYRPTPGSTFIFATMVHREFHPGSWSLRLSPATRFSSSRSPGPDSIPDARGHLEFPWPLQTAFARSRRFGSPTSSVWMLPLLHPGCSSAPWSPSSCTRLLSLIAFFPSLGFAFTEPAVARLSETRFDAPKRIFTFLFPSRLFHLAVPTLT